MLIMLMLEFSFALNHERNMKNVQYICVSISNLNISSFCNGFFERNED